MIKVSKVGKVKFQIEKGLTGVMMQVLKSSAGRYSDVYVWGGCQVFTNWRQGLRYANITLGFVTFSDCWQFVMYFSFCEDCLQNIGTAREWI